MRWKFTPKSELEISAFFTNEHEYLGKKHNNHKNLTDLKRPLRKHMPKTPQKDWKFEKDLIREGDHFFSALHC